MQLRRKTFVVKPGYQLRLALSFFAYIVIYSAILGFIIFYPLYRELNAAVSLEEQTRISSTVLFLHKRVWIGFLLVAALASINLILSTQRVAGPMYRFEKMVEELKKGNYALRIRTRKRDEFKEMAGLLNELAHTLEEKEKLDAGLRSQMKERLETLLNKLEAQGKACPDEAGGLVRGLISEIDNRGTTA